MILKNKVSFKIQELFDFDKKSQNTKCGFVMYYDFVRCHDGSIRSFHPNDTKLNIQWAYNYGTPIVMEQFYFNGLLKFFLTVFQCLN